MWVCGRGCRGGQEGDTWVCEGGCVGARGRMRRCAREDAWVREGGYVGMLTGMRKLMGNKA